MSGVLPSEQGRRAQALGGRQHACQWKLTSEPHAAQAAELLPDWEAGVVSVCLADQALVEVVSAFLGTCRKHPPRLSVPEAKHALEDILEAPFTVYRAAGKGVLTRAFEIAYQYNQRVYDCVHVALAERKRAEFWTGDERLFNALHLAFPLIRRIADYQRKRPSS